MNHACRRSLLTFALLAPSLACEQPKPASFSVVVRVESDPGKPLAGAQLTTEGRPLGQSDQAGAVQLALTGKPGDVVVVDTRCPEGHRPPSAPLSVVLRSTAEQKSPEFRVICQPLQRRVVLSVRAQNGGGLPVRYLGQEIARTDAAGAAHALLEAAPGESLTVTLDTSAPEHARLMPQNPELKVVVPERDEVVVFDQTFTLAPLPAEPRKHHRRAPRGPQKIGSRHP